jgi:membrane-associated phospholipid phosphatase
MFKIFFLVALLYFILLSFQPDRYNIWYPTISEAYPNNAHEIKIMIHDYIQKRTPEDIQFFKLTDSNSIEAFKGKISEEQFQRLTKIVSSPKIVQKIMFYKKLYNRARPVQVAPEIIDALYSTTANTPAYPSGHAIQAYYAAKILSQWEPSRKKEWMEIANRVANIRIIGGVHYPSDRDFGRWLVDNKF